LLIHIKLAGDVVSVFVRFTCHRTKATLSQLSCQFHYLR
jgi:hypothetical protein